MEREREIFERDVIMNFVIDEDHTLVRASYLEHVFNFSLSSNERKRIEYDRWVSTDSLPGEILEFLPSIEEIQLIRFSYGFKDNMSKKILENKIYVSIRSIFYWGEKTYGNAFEVHRYISIELCCVIYSYYNKYGKDVIYYIHQVLIRELKSSQLQCQFPHLKYYKFKGFCEQNFVAKSIVEFEDFLRIRFNS